jgi:hypothetical protein
MATGMATINMMTAHAILRLIVFSLQVCNP